MNDDSTLLDHITIDSGPEPDTGVIWLHGLGADGHDFEPIVQELGIARVVPIRFIFPHAPHRAITWNNGYVMRAWYDVVRIAADAPQDAAGIAASTTAVEALIDELNHSGIATERIILAGFSQGGALALHAGIRQARRLAGIMCLSSYLPLADRLESERHAANQDVPIFMAHGILDTVVPFALGEKCRTRLEGLDYRIEWREYTMAHSVCGEEIGDIDAWLKRVLTQT